MFVRLGCKVTISITNELHCQEVKKRLNRIVLALNLVQCKPEKPKFLGNPNSYVTLGGGWVVGG